MPKYIEADALMNFANNHKNKSVDSNDIARFTAADVAPVRHAHWVEESGKIPRCSACGFYSDDADQYPILYCPNCGARMDAPTAGTNSPETAYKSHGDAGSVAGGKCLHETCDGYCELHSDGVEYREPCVQGPAMILETERPARNERRAEKMPALR